MVKNVRREKSRGLNELTQQPLTVGTGDIIVVIWQMGNMSTLQHSNFPRKSRKAWERILCFAVLFFNCCPTHMDVFISLWALNRIWFPETQKGKSHTCYGAKLV